MTDLIATLEHDVIIAWDDFTKGVKWLETEASAVGAWLQHVDPAIGAQFQALIQDGEQAASALALYGGQALSGLIAGAVPEAEQIVASLISNSIGASPQAVIASKGSAQLVADVGDIMQSVGKIALAKVLGAIASAANAASATPAS